MSVELISQFLTKYHRANLVSFNNYMEMIKSKSQLTKEELEKLIIDSKYSLQGDFNSNLYKIAEEINFDLDIEITHPFIKDLQVKLIDLLTIMSIHSTNKVILEWFDNETKKFIY
ncbi:hypothetical protein SAMN05421594_3130 [Chryseobacterium oleae]|uniref:Uncharacterized protein n=1 Tax=Chryseobacterium oleae TaxID=491207 RepID=A0A1I4ZNZ2_CHROL|nr:MULTISPECIES: hypothetical protein [Chryseobacterium]SFN51974.1 hypothetical protein SAMN05421594_3130 [Chryseobacterium oleae]